MPIKFQHRDYTKMLTQKMEANKRKLLKASVERVREGTRRRMRFDTGAGVESVYIAGPGFEDYFERLTEAAKKYEGKEMLPGVGREMKIAAEWTPPDDDTAGTGIGGGHMLEWELGLGVSAEPSLLPAAEEEARVFSQEVAEGLFR